MYYYTGTLGFGMGALDLVVHVLWWVFIVWLLFVIFAPSSRSPRLHPGMKTPLDLLKERYAKGEIDKKEFEEKKKDLNE